MATEDIVTRLRDRLEESFCHCVEDPFFVCSYCAIEEAADEIERLRADVKRWRNWAEYFFYTDPECECPTCDQVRAAIGSTK